MRCVTEIILIVFVVQTNAKDSRDKLVDELVDSIVNKVVDWMMKKSLPHLAVPAYRLSPHSAPSLSTRRIDSPFPLGGQFQSISKGNPIRASNTEERLLSSPVRLPSVWEIDFFSRPVTDERGKKIWELVVTDQDTSFVFSEFFPSNEINSNTFKKALDKFLDATGAQRPQKCRFFRSQMQNMITRALTDMGIEPVPSRRCFGLVRLLEQRSNEISRASPTYLDMGVFSSDFSNIEALPDQLKGEQWEFVSLPASELQQEAQEVIDGELPGSALDLSKLSKKITPETPIPGVVVLSGRARTLATWSNTLEMATIYNSPERSCLILETGISDRWLYAPYRKSELNNQLAQAWEQAKKDADGLHFLAIQEKSESEDVQGLWLMQERGLPT